MTFFSFPRVYNPSRKGRRRLEETVIYADVLFVINFLADGICLAMTALLLGRPFAWGRFTGACVLGGLYSLAALPINGLHPGVAFLVHGVFALFICLAAFPCKSFSSAVASAVCFFVSCSLLGGAIWAIYSLCGAYASYNGVFYFEASPVALLCSVSVTGILLLFCILKSKGRARARHGELKLFYRRRECALFCLADSGNLLCCPFTGLPVVIVSSNALLALFEKSELDAMRDAPVGKGIRPIPVRGIGGSTVLPSFVPDRCEVRLFGKKEYKSTRLCIAVDLTGKSFGGCDGIAPTNIF